MDKESRQLSTLTKDSSQAVEGQASGRIECISDNDQMDFTAILNEETEPGSECEQFEQPSGNSISGRNDHNATVQWNAAKTVLDNGSSETSGEVMRWLELYDPDYEVMYYFSQQSGEFRWGPLKASALIRQCNCISVLSAIVSLQCAARGQQARKKVMMMQQKLEMYSSDQSITTENSHRDEDPAHNNTPYTTANLEVPLYQWFEVYDPTTQVQYFYNSCTGETRWDLPDNCVFSIDERKNAAAISIQSLSRGYIARNQVRDYRERSLLVGVKHTYQEGKTSCRGMKDPQHRDGNFLEGFDDCKKQSVPYFVDIEKEQVVCERLAREQEKKEDARMLMHHEEKLQCQRGDNFWGIQAEEARQNATNIAMALEEESSRHFEDTVLEQALKATWEDKKLQLLSNEQAAYNGLRQRMQARYLRWFYHQCESVGDLLDYRWPTHQLQERPKGASSPVRQRRNPICAESVTLAPPHSGVFASHNHSKSGDLHYRLRTSLTVHYQSICKPNGTHFVVTNASRDCAFDEATAAKLIKARNMNEGVVNECKPHIGKDSRMKKTKKAPTVNYDQYRTPNPHLPARFNRVPYKPNQISPTRDILDVNHRKLNQLPSLVKTMITPKICQPQKVKMRTKSNFDALSNPAPPSLKSEGGVDLKMDTDNASLHAHFERQDHAILFKIFSLLDLDQSGIVNLDEMGWALQHDAEIHTLAKTSPLLRILLKQGDLEESLFTRSVDPSENSKELSYDAFLAGGERSYLRLVSNGLIKPHVVTRFETRSGADKIASDKEEERENSLAGEMEILSIRRVFAMLDSGNKGLLNAADIQRNLYDLFTITPETSKETSTYEELRGLVKASNALHLMFHQKILKKAFTTYEPMDPGGINEEEFVAFCLEFAQIAITNHMVAPIN